MARAGEGAPPTVLLVLSGQSGSGGHKIRCSLAGAAALRRDPGGGPRDPSAGHHHPPDPARPSLPAPPQQEGYGWAALGVSPTGGGGARGAGNHLHKSRWVRGGRQPSHFLGPAALPYSPRLMWRDPFVAHSPGEG